MHFTLFSCYRHVGKETMSEVGLACYEEATTVHSHQTKQYTLQQTSCTDKATQTQWHWGGANVQNTKICCGFFFHSGFHSSD